MSFHTSISMIGILNLNLCNEGTIIPFVVCLVRPVWCTAFHLPNLWILCVLYTMCLLQTLMYSKLHQLFGKFHLGACWESSVSFPLPWLQITHFKDGRARWARRLMLPSSSSLFSLTNLEIYRPRCLIKVNESAFHSPYQPTTKGVLALKKKTWGQFFC